jgi:hypothetical protein
MRKGQVMLLSVLIISGAILGTTAIAGLLMLFQVRQATNITLSMQALFAADTGVEWELFKLFKSDVLAENPDLDPKMTNDTCIFTSTDSGPVGEGFRLRSIGCAGGGAGVTCRPNNCPRPVNRAFEVVLEAL